MTKKKLNKKPTITITIDKEVHDAIIEKSKKERRSISNFVNLKLLEALLKKQ
jgi:predicted CopG family antitoxin